MSPKWFVSIRLTSCSPLPYFLIRGTSLSWAVRYPRHSLPSWNTKIITVWNKSPLHLSLMIIHHIIRKYITSRVHTASLKPRINRSMMDALLSQLQVYSNLVFPYVGIKWTSRFLQSGQRAVGYISWLLGASCMERVHDLSCIWQKQLY
jgi:hypothetical protein